MYLLVQDPVHYVRIVPSVAGTDRVAFAGSNDDGRALSVFPGSQLSKKSRNRKNRREAKEVDNLFSSVYNRSPATGLIPWSSEAVALEQSSQVKCYTVSKAKKDTRTPPRKKRSPTPSDELEGARLSTYSHSGAGPVNANQLHLVSAVQCRDTLTSNLHPLNACRSAEIPV